MVGYMEKLEPMIEKVTVRMTDRQDFALEGNKGCTDMKPKELLLFAAAKCAGKTALKIMRQERVMPRRFEISYTGEPAPDDAQPGDLFRSFHVVYNVACNTDDQAKVGRAIRLTHDKYCGMTQLLRKIAPVSDEIAVVGAEGTEA